MIKKGTGLETFLYFVRHIVRQAKGLIKPDANRPSTGLVEFPLSYMGCTLMTLFVDVEDFKMIPPKLLELIHNITEAKKYGQVQEMPILQGQAQKKTCL